MSFAERVSRRPLDVDEQIGDAASNLGVEVDPQRVKKAIGVFLERHHRVVLPKINVGKNRIGRRKIIDIIAEIDSALHKVGLMTGVEAGLGEGDAAVALLVDNTRGLNSIGSSGEPMTSIPLTFYLVKGVLGEEGSIHMSGWYLGSACHGIRGFDTSRRPGVAVRLNRQIGLDARVILPITK